MHITYKTQETCSKEINFDIENNKIHNVSFTGGCNGNLKGISALVENKDKDEVIKILKGIKCNYKDTSCPDQLAKALESIKTEE